MEHLPSEDALTGDSELLALAASGDAAAFELFVIRHRNSVWGFARSLTRDVTKAEDAMQETFLSAWKGASSFRGEGSAVGWLLSIARNAVYRQHRSKEGAPDQIESMTELGRMAGWGAEPDPMEAFVVKDEVERAMASLPMEDQEILLLREVEGLSNEDCARALQISLPAVKSRLHRARLRFAGYLRGVRHGQ